MPSINLFLINHDITITKVIFGYLSVFQSHSELRDNFKLLNILFH